MKKCSKCGVEKEESEFNSSFDRRVNRRYLKPSCRECCKKAFSEWRTKNIDRERSRNRESRKKRKDKIKEWRKGYYGKNIKEILVKAKERYYSDEYRKYLKDNKERIIDQKRKYDKKKVAEIHPSYMKYIMTMEGWDRLWLQKNPEIVNTRIEILKIKRYGKNKT
jgi:hypothetical protein